MIEITETEPTIFIDNDSLSHLKLDSYTNIAILVDENTKKYCLDKLISDHPFLKKAELICLGQGEEYKTLESCCRIWDVLSDLQFDRSSLLICLGGGVICDIGGFAASSFKRGIDFINIPTTLLSMVDASLGGKNGIDYKGLKNQIGSFNNPKQIVIHPGFLKTLDSKQIKSGFAEVIKHALIADKEYWNLITNTSFEKINWEEIIFHSIRIKNKFVCQDPFDKSIRKQLNFGHTIGHAIESYYLSIKKPILHGEAIAMGMIIESKLSNLNNDALTEIIQFLQLQMNLPELPKFDLIYPWLANDKKNKKNKILFSLLTQIGECQHDVVKTKEEISQYF